MMALRAAYVLVGILMSWGVAMYGIVNPCVRDPPTAPVGPDNPYGIVACDYFPTTLQLTVLPAIGDV
jgi:hypothetical protein